MKEITISFNGASLLSTVEIDGVKVFDSLDNAGKVCIMAGTEKGDGKCQIVFLNKKD